MTAPPAGDGGAAHAKPSVEYQTGEFRYLLNAMEAAGHANYPAKAGYAEKRVAVYQHVADLCARLSAQEVEIARPTGEVTFHRGLGLDTLRERDTAHSEIARLRDGLQKAQWLLQQLGSQTHVGKAGEGPEAEATARRNAAQAGSDQARAAITPERPA